MKYIAILFSIIILALVAARYAHYWDGFSIFNVAPVQESPPHQDPQPKTEPQALPLESTKHTCMDYFVAIDNLVVKFFNQQDFIQDVQLLSASAADKNINRQLELILREFNYVQPVVINPKMLDQVFHIEKKFIKNEQKEQFLQNIKAIQQYFYSAEFIKSCYEN